MSADHGTAEPGDTAGLIEQLPAALAVVAPDGSCVLNAAAVEVVGAPRERESFVALFDERARDDATELVAAAREGIASVRTLRLVDAPPIGPDDRQLTTADGLQVDIGDHEPLPRFVEVRASGSTFGPGRVVVALTDVSEARRTAGVLEAAVMSVWVLDERGRLLWGPVGHALEAEAEGYGQGSMADRVHPEDLSKTIDAFVAVQGNPGARSVVELRGRHPDDQTTWLTSVYEFANLDDSPHVDGILLVTKETHERTDVVSLGRTSGSHLSVAEAAPVGIILTGPLGLPLYYNQAAMRLLPGVGIDDSGTLERDWTKFAVERDHATLHELIAQALDTRSQRSLLARFVPKEGDACWLLTTICPRLSEDARVIGFVVTLQDVTQEVEAKEQLEEAQRRLLHLANHDPLTGLINRAQLAADLADRLARTSGDDAGLAVLFCDLDGFKSINDEFGHAAGDQILAAAARRLGDVVEAADPHAVVARVGGDEFVVVLGGGADDGLPVAVGEVADRLVHAMSLPFDLEGHRWQIGMSVGVATARDGDDPESIVQRADAAMYDAKALGRGRVVHATG